MLSSMWATTKFLFQQECTQKGRQKQIMPARYGGDTFGTWARGGLGAFG